MWFLSYDHDDERQKQPHCLRPGSKEILGSSTTDIPKDFISPVHLTIRVCSDEPAPGARPSRPEVVLVDSSKEGTWVDGVKISRKRGKSTPGQLVLGRHTSRRSPGRHEIRLGRWKVPWRLEWRPEWQPIVLTVTRKSRVDEMQQRLGPLGVTILSKYVVGETTHVLAVKRNLPIVLHALVNAKFVVSEAFVAALEEWARGNVPDWPNEEDFVPPEGGEPIPRASRFLLPDRQRERVFEGYVFIFCDTNQFDHLSPVITQGAGEAVPWTVQPGSEDSSRFIQYVKNLARERTLDGGAKNVVVVRVAKPDKPYSEWWADFYSAIDAGLGQQSINQNKFLDAILTKYAAVVLRQPLPQEEVEHTLISPPRDVTDRSRIPLAAPQKEEPQIAQVPMSRTLTPPPVSRGGRTGIHRSTLQPRLQVFDDFDPDALRKMRQGSDIHTAEGATNVETLLLEAPSQRPSNLPAQTATTAGMKREHRHVDIIEISDDDTALTPAAAPKRRKLSQKPPYEAVSANHVAQTTHQSSRTPLTNLGIIVPNTEPVETIDVYKTIRQQWEQKEERLKTEFAALHKAVDSDEMVHIADLVRIEFMDIRPRDKTADDNERWNPEWNGRKNVKRFKKSKLGDPNGVSLAPPRSCRIMVSLEPLDPRESRLCPDGRLLLENNIHHDTRMPRLNDCQSKLDFHPQDFSGGFTRELVLRPGHGARKANSGTEVNADQQGHDSRVMNACGKRDGPGPRVAELPAPKRMKCSDDALPKPINTRSGLLYGLDGCSDDYDKPTFSWTNQSINVIE